MLKIVIYATARMPVRRRRYTSNYLEGRKMFFSAREILVTILQTISRRLTHVCDILVQYSTLKRYLHSPTLSSKNHFRMNIFSTNFNQNFDYFVRTTWLKIWAQWITFQQQMNSNLLFLGTIHNFFSIINILY